VKKISRKAPRTKGAPARPAGGEDKRKIAKRKEIKKNKLKDIV
jgi:hypothetical protein